MKALSRPEVICSHESDLDGLLAAMLMRRLAERLFGGSPLVQAWNYQGWRNRPLVEPTAWVADFSYETRLNRHGWVLFDHHSPTAPTPKAGEWRLDYRFKADKAAATLVYEVCVNHGLASSALDRLVHLNQIGDLWQHEDPDFELATDYASLVKSYGFWSLYKLVEGQPERLLDHALLEVMAVKRRIEDPIGYEWSRANIEEITPELAVVQTTVGNTNLLVHQLLDRRATPHKVLATLFPKANRTVVVSLRSRNGEALGVATRLDGGGHPNAAGATLPKSVTNVEAALAYLLEVLVERPSNGWAKEPTFEGLRL